MNIGCNSTAWAEIAGGSHAAAANVNMHGETTDRAAAKMARQ